MSKMHGMQMIILMLLCNACKPESLVLRNAPNLLEAIPQAKSRLVSGLHDADASTQHPYWAVPLNLR